MKGLSSDCAACELLVVAVALPATSSVGEGEVGQGPEGVVNLLVLPPNKSRPVKRHGVESQSFGIMRGIKFLREVPTDIG